jgi:ArsR family transcriptional regulator
MDEKAAVHALTALAHEARLRIFRALVGAGPDGLTPSVLAALLDLQASTLSFHLKELSNADLVSVERDGRQLFYRPQLNHMNELLGYLVDHCCQGQSCAPMSDRDKVCSTASSC